jgi:hypothetical protein
MSNQRIEKLTPEQEALIPIYLEKWQKIALSTEAIDRQKASDAIKSAYNLINISEPKNFFLIALMPLLNILGLKACTRN